MKFLSILGIVLFNLISYEAARCANPATRKEIRELNPTELKDFTDALNILHSTPSNSIRGISKYEEFSRIHVQRNRNIHYTSQFLPWHRYFLRLLEIELQKIRPGVVIPYWDWSFDAQEPHNSPVLSSKYFGGNGDSDNDHCVTDGAFANWQMSYPNRHCLKREYNRNGKLSQYPLPESIVLDLNEPRFSSFSSKLEIKHGSAHVSIGGASGDMRPMHSPNDPLFFLHHGFIDLLWAEWQSRHPESEQYEGLKTSERANLNDQIIGYPASVGGVLDTQEEFLCYRYRRYATSMRMAGMSPEGQKKVDDLFNKNAFFNGPMANQTWESALRTLPQRRPQTLRSLSVTAGEFKIEPPIPLPEDFIQNNGLDRTEVRKVESENALLARLLDSTQNFASISNIPTIVKDEGLQSLVVDE